MFLCHCPGHKLRFFEFEDAVHDYYGFPITMDALPFCTCTLHVLYMYLAFAYMYLAFAYMYFTCTLHVSAELKAGGVMG